MTTHPSLANHDRASDPNTNYTLNIYELAERAISASNDLRFSIDNLNASDADFFNNLCRQHKQVGADLIVRIEQIASGNMIMLPDRRMLERLEKQMDVHDLQRKELAQFRGYHNIPVHITDDGDDSCQAKPEDGGSANSMSTQASSATGSRAVSFTSTSTQKSSVPASVWWNREGVSAEEQVKKAHREARFGDKASWPLYYRIVDIDPSIPDPEFGELLRLRQEELELKHNPDYMRDDEEASKRWAVCSTALRTLADSGLKAFYDKHGEGTDEFESPVLRSMAFDEIVRGS